MGNPGANDQMAVASVGLGAAGLVTSCLSFLCCIGYVSVPLGIAAIVTGVMSLQRQKQTGAGGRPLALAGIACGAVGIVIPIVALILSLALGIGGGMMQGMSQGLNQH